MARTATVAALLLALASLAPPASAHHSFSALYDADKPVRLTGTLTKLEWTNPHSIFHLNVKRKDGSVQEWLFEAASPGALSRRGFSRGKVQVGDTLIVDGFLAKNGARLVDARRITLPDGTVVAGGTAGDGGPQGDLKPARPVTP